jgi:hypothetical protein
MSDPIEITLKKSRQPELFPEENMFWGLGSSYQTIPYVQCQTPGMSLWLALHFIGTRTVERREPTPREYNVVLRAIRFPVLDSCLCKDCKKYRKLTKKKKSATV